MQDNHVNMTLVSPAMQKEQEVSSRKETGMVRPNDFGSDIRNIDTLRFYIRADFRSRGVQEPFLRAVFADPIVRFTFLMRVLEYANWPGFTPRGLALLEAYPWPGNVRELRNVIERAVYRHEDPERPIDEINFNPFHSPWAPTATDTVQTHAAAAEAAVEELASPRAEAPPPSSTGDFRGAVTAYERQLLEDALQRNRFNQRATAAALGLSYDQLRHALKRHKLQDSAA
jgi:hypothetical protein